MTVESITFFFPAFNERENVGACIETTRSVIADLDIADWEIVFVDDGSVDGTADAIRHAAEGDPRIRIERHETNRGYGEAVVTGLRSCRKDWLFMTDADLQFDVADIAKLLPLAEQHDFVQGARLARADRPARVLLGRIFRGSMHLLFPLPVRDPECAFRLVRAEELRGAEITSRGPLVPVELVCRAHKLGMRFAEVEVRHFPRQHGESKAVTVKAVSRLAIDIAKLFVSIRLGGRSVGQR